MTLKMLDKSGERRYDWIMESCQYGGCFSLGTQGLIFRQGYLELLKLESNNEVALPELPLQSIEKRI